MMTTQDCQKARALLMAYVDSELDAATTLSVREHLSACAACARRFEREERLERGLANQLRDEPMPGDVSQRLDECLARPIDTSRVPRRNWAGVGRWAAAALILLSAILYAVSPSEVDQVAPTRWVGELVAAWERSADVGDPTVARGALGTRDLLDAHQLQAFAVRAQATEGGHPIRLLGAREESFHGVRAVNVLYDCCGSLTSVFVMPRKALDSLPSDVRPSLPGVSAPGREPEVGGRRQESILRGVRTSTWIRDGLYIGVVSRHASALMDLASG
jgi:anti-sigma factor RsiW